MNGLDEGWRRERDSNPRSQSSRDNRFRGGRFRPLSHLSENTIIFNDCKNLEQSTNKSMSFKYALFALPEEIGLFLTGRIGKD